MASPSITGSVEVINSSANSGSTSVSVPSDTTAILFFWDGWTSADGLTMSSASLAGSGFTLLQNLTKSGDLDAVGVGILLSPATGTQTFAWDWSGSDTIDDGPNLILVFIKDANVSDAVADSGALAYDVNGPTTDGVTLSTPAGDELVIGAAFSYSPAGPTNGAPSGSDQTVVTSHTFNNNDGDVITENTTDTPTTSLTATGYYLKVVAVALKAVGGGGPPATLAGRLSLLGVGG